MQSSKLQQLKNRVVQLEALANEITDLAEKMKQGESVQPELSIKGEQWYRGARELLQSNNFSGLEDFEKCYECRVGTSRRAFADIGTFIQFGLNPYRTGNEQFDNSKEEYHGAFTRFFTKARALIRSLESEVLSRELPVLTQLSFAVVSDEFETANSLIQANTEETIVRAAGVIARVALERHLHVVIEANGLTIILPSPKKKKAEAFDLINTLHKNNHITSVQKSELEFLFKIGNNCAHPKETVDIQDVKKLIKQGKELASIIV